MIVDASRRAVRFVLSIVDSDERSLRPCRHATMNGGLGPNHLRAARSSFGRAVVLGLAVASMPVRVALEPAALAAQETPRGDVPGGELAPVVDSVVTTGLDETGVPGAVVVAIREGQIVLSEGYGSADPRSGVPMSDSAVILTVGSLAKPLTAAAVLRLAARGELDLDRDLRERASALELPIRHDAPVTAAHLLTHTSGFDDTEFGDAARRPEDAVSLEERLRHAMPIQSFAPGRFYRYSNHGYALLGWLLQEVSGTAFAALLDRELFGPLGMGSSSFEQVPPDAVEGRMATGHVPGEEGPRAVRPDFSNVVPADGLLTTGADMGRFLLALTGGSEAGVLPTEVREGMLETAFTYHDSLPGVTFAFQERPVQDWSGLQHTGGRNGFTTQIVLVPEKRFGLFVALNLRDGAARSRLTEDLLDVLLPESEERMALSEDAVPVPESEPGRLTGAYRSIRYNRHTIEKLAVLLGLVPTVSVERAPGRALHIGGGNFYETSPLLFRWEEARWYNVFFEQEGTITHLASGHSAFERTAWWEDPDLHQALFWAAALVLLLVLAVESWRWTGGRGSWAGEGPEAGSRRAEQLLTATAAALLTGLGLLAFTLRDLASTADYGAPVTLKLALAALLAGVLLTVPAGLAIGIAWVRGSGTAVTRLRLGAGALAALVLVTLLFYWNLIGFNY